MRLHSKLFSISSVHDIVGSPIISSIEEIAFIDIVSPNKYLNKSNRCDPVFAIPLV